MHQQNYCTPNRILLVELPLVATLGNFLYLYSIHICLSAIDSVAWEVTPLIYSHSFLLYKHLYILWRSRSHFHGKTMRSWIWDTDHTKMPIDSRLF